MQLLNAESLQFPLTIKGLEVSTSLLTLKKTTKPVTVGSLSELKRAIQEYLPRFVFVCAFRNFTFMGLANDFRAVEFHNLKVTTETTTYEVQPL